MESLFTERHNKEGIVRKFGKVISYCVYTTLLYSKWITNKDVLYSTWNCDQCYVADWIGGEFGENGDMYV